MNPLTAQLAETLPAGTQEHVHALKTDHHLVRTAPLAQATEPAWLYRRRWSWQLHFESTGIHVIVLADRPKPRPQVVKGSGGSIYALGDAATIQEDKALDHAAELFRRVPSPSPRAIPPMPETVI